MDSEIYKKTSKISLDTIKLLEISRTFNDGIGKIREKYKIKVEKRASNLPMTASEILKNNRGDQFKKDIRDILIKNKLPNNFFDAVMEKIIYGRFISIPASSYGVALSAHNIHIVIYQRPTKLEWNSIKKEVDKLIMSDNDYMKRFNYPDGTKVRRPKKDIDKTISILRRVQAGASNTDIEFEEYYDENAEMDKTVDKRNVGKIKSKKRRYKEIL
jgi:hypothetical protein